MPAASLPAEWANPEWEDLIKRKLKTNHDKTVKYATQDYGQAAWNLQSALKIDLRSDLTPKQIEITEAYDATALLEQIANGTLKSEEVARAFCARAAIAHSAVNCLTEIMFEEAIDRAKQLDEYLEKTGKTRGPLHGLPVSLKVSSVSLDSVSCGK